MVMLHPGQPLRLWVLQKQWQVRANGLAWIIRAKPALMDKRQFLHRPVEVFLDESSAAAAQSYIAPASQLTSFRMAADASASSGHDGSDGKQAPELSRIGASSSVGERPCRYEWAEQIITKNIVKFTRSILFLCFIIAIHPGFTAAAQGALC
jgi:hypothetical protein